MDPPTRSHRNSSVSGVATLLPASRQTPAEGFRPEPSSPGRSRFPSHRPLRCRDSSRRDCIRLPRRGPPPGNPESELGQPPRGGPGRGRRHRGRLATATRRRRHGGHRRLWWSAEAPGTRKYIVCNADEGDSGTFADRMLMEGDPFVLIEGMAIAAHAVGAQQGYVYVRSEYPHAIAKLNAAIALTAARLAPFASKCASAPGPMSAARRLRCSTPRRQTRRSARQAAVARARRPVRQPDRGQQRADAGGGAVDSGRGGSGDYGALGYGRSKGTMPIQLAGNIRHGGLFEAAFGITLGELVDEIGGGTASGTPGQGGAGRRAARAPISTRAISTCRSITRPLPPTTR